jgi:hypothetical protein
MKPKAAKNVSAKPKAAPVRKCKQLASSSVPNKENNLPKYVSGLVVQKRKLKLTNLQGNAPITREALKVFSFCTRRYLMEGMGLFNQTIFCSKRRHGVGRKAVLRNRMIHKEKLQVGGIGEGRGDGGNGGNAGLGGSGRLGE